MCCRNPPFGAYYGAYLGWPCICWCLYKNVVRKYGVSKLMHGKMLLPVIPHADQHFEVACSSAGLIQVLQEQRNLLWRPIIAVHYPLQDLQRPLRERQFQREVVVGIAHMTPVITGRLWEVTVSRAASWGSGNPSRWF